jgi:hypothetical protein
MFLRGSPASARCSDPVTWIAIWIRNYRLTSNCWSRSMCGEGSRGAGPPSGSTGVRGNDSRCGSNIGRFEGYPCSKPFGRICVTRSA